MSAWYVLSALGLHPAAPGDNVYILTSPLFPRATLTLDPEMLGTVDRKRRLARRIAADRGWRALTVSAWLVVAESTTNRRRIAEHRATFRAALPQDGRTARAWLQHPAGELRALATWSNRHPGTIRSSAQAVGAPNRSSARAIELKSCSGRWSNGAPDPSGRGQTCPNRPGETI